MTQSPTVRRRGRKDFKQQIVLAPPTGDTTDRCGAAQAVDYPYEKRRFLKP